MTHWITDIQNEIFEFWFGKGDPQTGLDPTKQKVWFTKNPDTDREIASRFGGFLDRAADEGTPAGLDSPLARLAMIILLDQFSRNIYRDHPRAFATDKIALKLSLDGCADHLDRHLNPIQRVFFYLPLEHAEDLSIQNQSVEAFKNLCQEVDPSIRSVFDGFLDYAERHREVIRRFGRFPHRNKILGRESNAKELAYLKQPGSGF